MADAWLIVSRLALYVSMMLVFGIPVFMLQATRGHWLQLPIAQRLVVVVGYASVLAIAASGLGLWAMARSMSGSANPSDVWEVASVLLTQTSVGMAWDLRVLSLVLVSCLAFLFSGWLRERIVALVVLGGAALATLAWAGHGAMNEGALGALHLSSDIVHLLIAGAWVGAMLALALIATSADDQEADETVRLLSSASIGFASFGTLIVSVLVVTGTINYLLVVGPSLSGLVTSTYGRLLLVKLGIFVGMLGLAAANRFRHAPTLERALDEGDASAATRALKASLWAEIGLATLVLALVAWLGTLNPAD